MSDSRSTPANAGWHDVILRQKYNNPTKLKNALDSMYGQGRYKVMIRANRYILQLPEPFVEAQILEIENAVRFHYKN